MSDQLQWEQTLQGNFRINKAIAQALPNGAKIISAEFSGISAWTQTARVSVILSNGDPKHYFLKCAKGSSARALAEGEYHSATAINEVVPNLVPKPAGWGHYQDGDAEVYFYLGDFHNMECPAAPDADDFMSQIAELHTKGVSPNGMFGYPIPTVIGRMQRTVTWEKSWAESFTHQLRDVIGYDIETNGPWPELDAACAQLIAKVIPRLLGVLQSEGREIMPVLVHGDLWEQNIGVDKDTGRAVLFDPGCTYAHNEMEFGTWRCTWASHFRSPTYMSFYQSEIEPSEPAEEWDDRNRLYSLHPYLTDSAGHPGSASRQIAYNDMLFLCEKYAPLSSLEKYDAGKDPSCTGQHIPFVIKQLE
ncbi:Fructosamine kinase-domain-containing protein [Xylariaceae sp. FL0804]|nr:Fructosamine kinase-domain-containing protein [Xylariaceae sp. FL0804]